MAEDDGVDELLGGAVRVAGTAAGQVLERGARVRAEQARERTDVAARQAAADRARAEALGAVERVPRREEATALAVVLADDRRAGVEEALEARTVAARNQGRPAVEAVRAPSAQPGHAAQAGRGGRARGVERDRGR